MQSHQRSNKDRKRSARGTPEPERFHHGNLRQALIDAALRQPDIEGLSLRQLAAGLGVSAAAVYRHFENRDDLLCALVQIGFVRLQQRFAIAFPIDETPVSATEAKHWLRRLALAYLGFADEEPALWRLMFGVQAAPYRVNPAPAPRPSSASYLPAALEALFKTGIVPQAPAETDVLFAWGAIHGLAMLRAGRIPTALGPLSDLAAAFTDHIVKALGGQRSLEHSP